MAATAGNARAPGSSRRSRNTMQDGGVIVAVREADVRE
jgi:hypothetical protein